jgi:type IV pilus assembly protein PilW
LILTGLAVLFADTSRSRTEIQRASEEVDNGRYAFDVLAQDMQLAGYFAELSVDALPVPEKMPDLCSFAPSDWRAAIPMHVQGFDENAATPSCLPARVVGSDVVSIRRVRTCATGSPGCSNVVPTLPYLQVNLCGTAGKDFTVGIASNTAFPHKGRDCIADALQRQYLVNIYFVSPDNGAGSPIPTLKRLEMTGSGYTEVPLVEGIQTLQIEYGVDTDGDGGPDIYTADPSTFTPPGCPGCTQTSVWANVVTAKIHVLSRAIDPSPGYTNGKVYTLGSDATGNPMRLGPFSDGFRRRVYSGMVRIMNPSGRRDRP